MARYPYWRQPTPEERAYFRDHEKRLHDAQVAASWGENQLGQVFRQITGRGFIKEE